MRLLLRSNSHRDVDDGCLELAASPDTPRRELWQWDLRLLPADRPQTNNPKPVRRVSAGLTRGDGSVSRLEVCADPTAALPSIEVLQLDGLQRIGRGTQEVVAVVVGRGLTLAEGRHRLGELDVMILEGDDPYDLSLEPQDGAAASVAVVRLEGVGAIGWVP
ncbi:hypothetical protein [Arthrobacter sp. NPDC089319]|uniref:hypothetical protein n=1 Tax=Arthrobacter sp. NPDC089319 TaxID=3155915 RepID=UPI0034441D14